MLASRQLQSSWLADPYSTPITSISLSNSVYDLPRPHPPRGLKGFFSRSKSDHSEPAVISNPRVRPLAGSSTSRAPASSAARTRDQQRTPFNEVPTGRKQPGTEDRELNRSRPSSPDQLRRNIRFNPSVHPSIQKGKDGRWQPPSLSRGSMSTSALELYALEEGIARSTITPVEDSPMTKPKKGHKHTFSMLVSSKRLSPRDTSADKNGNEQDSAPRSAMNSQDEERTRANISYKMAPPAGSAASWVQMSPPHSPASPTTEIDPIRKSPASLQVPSRRSSVEMQHEDFKASSRSPPNSPRRYIPISPARSQYFRTRASASSSLPLPTHVESSADALISYEHDFLHLATSILIRNLTSTSNAEAVMQNGKDEVLRKLADENLFALSRMKEARDQARDTIDGEQPTIPVFLAARSFEPRIQATPIQESTSDKERKTFIGALQDGVLLCL